MIEGILKQNEEDERVWQAQDRENKNEIEKTIDKDPLRKTKLRELECVL